MAGKSAGKARANPPPAKPPPARPGPPPNPIRPLKPLKPPPPAGAKPGRQAGPKTPPPARRPGKVKRPARARRRRTGPPPGNLGKTAGKQLVIVESPAKARTVGQILGSRYVVTASQGHVRDLPKGKMGVDLKQDFAPTYVTLREKLPLVKEIKQAGEAADRIYLATDPDREGESHFLAFAGRRRLGWAEHRAAAAGGLSRNHQRRGAGSLSASPGNRYASWSMPSRPAASWIGWWAISSAPCWANGCSAACPPAGVQSVALRLVTDREQEIAAFVPVESWTLDAQLHKETDPPDKLEVFPAALHSVQGSRQRLNIPAEPEARRYEAELQDAAYTVAAVRKREARQRPAAPFTTSTLQQEAGRKLRFTAQRTMAVAQQLYEGLNIGREGSVGLITYMRTDSVQVAATAVQEARD